MKHSIFQRQKKEDKTGSMNQIVCLPQSDRSNSFAHLKQQKKNSSPSTSSQSSEDDVPSPPKTKTKHPPCYSRCAVSTATPARTRPSGGVLPSTSSCPRDDPREEERQEWRRFRERTKSRRSAVFSLRAGKPRPSPSEPSEFGSGPAPFPQSSVSASSCHSSCSCPVE